MITRTQESEGLWRYTCDVCGRSRVEKYENFRNPCPCNGIVTWPKSDPRRQLVEPSLVQKAKNLTVATTAHLIAGKPLCTDEQVAERFAICQTCPLFKPKNEGAGVCTHPDCGCSLRGVGVKGKNKLRWAEQVCPYTELENGIQVHRPKWGAIPK